MTQRIITVGHGADPADPFMFYTLAHNKIDTVGLQFVCELQDIESLNRRALRGVCLAGRGGGHDTILERYGPGMTSAPARTITEW